MPGHGKLAGVHIRRLLPLGHQLARDSLGRQEVMLQAVDPVTEHIGPAPLSSERGLSSPRPGLRFSRPLLRPHGVGQERFDPLLQLVGFSVGRRQRGIQLVDLSPQYISPSLVPHVRSSLSMAEPRAW